MVDPHEMQPEKAPPPPLFQQTLNHCLQIHAKRDENGEYCLELKLSTTLDILTTQVKDLLRKENFKATIDQSSFKTC
jgi:hypothetical protein